MKRFVLLNIIIVFLLLINCKLSANPFRINLPNDTNICYNSNISILAAYEFNTGPVKWKWQNGDSTQLSIILKGIKTFTKLYITAWDSAGNMSSDTMNISTIALPNITFSTIPGACANDTALIDLDSYVNPTGGNWYFDSNFLVGHKFSPALSKDGSFWPRYDYTDPVTGCSDTDYINVTVFPSPVSDFSSKPVTGIAPIQIDFTNNSVSVPGNHVNYLWDFGDGQFSTVKDPSHVFSISGNLKVCLNVFDTVTKCSDTYCRTLQILPYPGYLELAGYVYAGGQKANHGKVFLYKQQDVSGKTVYQLNDSTDIIDNNGYYSFSGVDSGIYLIKAVLDLTSSFYGTYFPTYFGDVIFWKKSSLLNIVTNFYGYDIHLVHGYKVSGSGGISGKTVAEGNPVSQIQVMLTDVSNNPVIYDFSKTDGSFCLPDISFGKYLIYTEITGITTYPMELVVDADHAKYENFFIEIVSQTGIENMNEQGMILSMLYPNPVEENGILNIYCGTHRSLEVTLYDLNGKIRSYQKEKLVPGENLISLKTTEFEPGLYIYCINIDKKLMLRDKLLKIK